MASATPTEYPAIDFARSAKNLSAWLQLQCARKREGKPTKTVKRMQGLAKRLYELADELWNPEWMELQAAVDEDLPPTVGLDGWPAHPSPEASRIGTYEACQWRMREIACIARKLAEEHPAPQARPYLLDAATAYLHLWLEDGRDPPTMYDEGGAVSEFARILEKGGHPLTASRVRGILSRAWNSFDAHLICPLFDQIVVWRQ